MNRGARFSPLIVLIALQLSCSGGGPSASQGLGRVEGLVSAGSWGPVPGARLVLTGASQWEASTDEAGRYAFPAVEPGPYVLVLHLPLGFDSGLSSSREVTVSQGTTDVDWSVNAIISWEEATTPGQPLKLGLASGAGVTVTSSTGSVLVEIEELISPPVSMNETVAPPFRLSLVSSANGSLAPSQSDEVNVKIWQRVDGGSSQAAALGLQVGPPENGLAFYGQANLESYVDPSSGLSAQRLYYEATMPGSTPITGALGKDFFFFMHYDEACGDSYRSLKPYSAPDYNVPLSDRTPVILIHGWQSTRTRCTSFAGFDPTSDGFRNLIDRLKPLSGYKIYIAKYPTVDRIIAASDFLLREIRRQQLDAIESKPILIGHSMGGLVGRGVMALSDPEEIRGLITLATPHEGTVLATGWEGTRCDEPFVFLLKKELCRFAAAVELATILRTPGVQDMAPGVPATYLGGQANGTKIYTLAGRVPIEEIVDPLVRMIAEITDFEGENDGIVEVSSATPPWTIRQSSLTGYDHLEMSRGNMVDGLLLDEELFDRIKDLLSRLVGGIAASGQVVDQFTRRPMAGISVTMSGFTTVTGADGLFAIPGAPSTSPRAISFVGPAIYTRKTFVVGGGFSWPVVPRSFDMSTFDDVMRELPEHETQTTRWTRNPHVYIDVVPRGFSRLPSAWVNEVMDAISQWIPYWSADQATPSTITPTASPPPDFVPNTIIFRFDASIRDAPSSSGLITVGSSDWRADSRGRITAAVIRLYYDASSVETDPEKRRRLLAATVGHSMGYGTRSRSGSNTVFHHLEWAAHSAPTAFDAQARLFLYGRPPHNVSPDTDIMENVLGSIEPSELFSVGARSSDQILRLEVAE